MQAQLLKSKFEFGFLKAVQRNQAFLDHQITSNYLTNHQAQASGWTGVRPVQ